MKKIAPVFQLQPHGIYLVKEFENVAVFPHETSGRFNRSLIHPSSVYVVNGEDVVETSNTSTSGLSLPSSTSITPFGAYSGPTSHLPPRSSLTQWRKSTTFRKTIALVSLSAPNPNKPSTSKSSLVEYKTVTQIVVTLEVGHCSLAAVAEAVSQQVMFEVVLLDSKCFPILTSETTNTTEFWKSNRKVLAASKTLYSKLAGSSTNPKCAKAEIDLTSDDDMPRPKRSCLSSHEKLDRILEGVDTLKKQHSFFDKVSAMFECVICKNVMCTPQFGSCCKRIVGCQSCINRWLDGHPSCPHCSTASTATNFSDLKGIDELLNFIRACQCCDATQCPGATHSNDSETRNTVVDSDSDLELPEINFRAA